MTNYFIIGGDGKEYGPITEADVRLWLAEGRLNAQTSTRSDADPNWRPLGELPEFTAVFAVPPTIAAPPSSENSSSHTAAPNVDFLERDYELDLGGCLTQGFELVKNNLGVFFVGALIYLCVEGAIGMLGNIPFIGPVFSLANFVIAGPFMGGVLWLFLRGVRGEPAEVGDVFAGFKRHFGQLFLATFVQGLFMVLCMIPFIVVFILKLLASGIHFDKHTFQPKPGEVPALPPGMMDGIFSLLLTTLPVLLVCLVPVLYLGTCWKFSLPLVMDKGMDFWTAMKTSMKMVNKHWWQVFGLMILVGLLNAAGIILCCIPVLFTMPVGFAALMFAYETIFGERKN
ncbi:MAG: hypothetical protein RL616_2654 [Verrucomicrobiota bacterium]|jgi:uncharacterized membrane protein